jgi:hypothetical protein
MSFSLLYKNIGFLVKNILFVSKKAEYHFNKAIEVSKNIGAIGYLGQAYLGLASLLMLRRTGYIIDANRSTLRLSTGYPAESCL